LESEERWTRGPEKRLCYKKKYPMRGIKFNVYLKEKGYPCFPNAICYSRTSRSEKFKGQIIIDGPWKFFKFRVCE
jgi:hypothetical protein